jgi:hypothetical protein
MEGDDHGLFNFEYPHFKFCQPNTQPPLNFLNGIKMQNSIEYAVFIAIFKLEPSDVKELTQGIALHTVWSFILSSGS